MLELQVIVFEQLSPKWELLNSLSHHSFLLSQHCESQVYGFSSEETCVPYLALGFWVDKDNLTLALHLELDDFIPQSSLAI